MVVSGLSFFSVFQAFDLLKPANISPYIYKELGAGIRVFFFLNFSVFYICLSDILFVGWE